MIQERQHVFVFFLDCIFTLCKAQRARLQSSMPACQRWVDLVGEVRRGGPSRCNDVGQIHQISQDFTLISHNFCDAHQIHQGLSPLLFQGLLKNRLVKCFGVGNRFGYPRVIPLSERRHQGSPNHQSTVQNQWPVMIRIILEWYTGCMKFMIGQTCSISTLLKHCLLYTISMPESTYTVQVISL